MAKMLPFYATEFVIPLGTSKAVFSEMRLHVRVEDHAAGPFLIMHGEYDGEEMDVYGPNGFALDPGEIDLLCNTLHRILFMYEVKE